MSKKYPRGAEWRIWDLQVHTPFSELNNGFGQDVEAYAKDFFTKAITKGVAVVGVTDYFVVDGYRYLKSLQNDDLRLASLLGEDLVAPAKAITLFANVELRTDVLVDGNRVNYHVIFSDTLSADDIQDDFLSQLEFTSEGNPGGPDQQSSLSRRNLETLGRTLKSQHGSFSAMSDVFVGMMQATVDHRKISEVLSRRQKKFGRKYVFCLPCDEDLSRVSWNGQGHMVRKVLVQKSHMLFTSNQNTRDFGLGLKHDSVDDYLKEFRTLKPCVHGSDAHSPSELFEPDESRLTWIKADPTFEGLLQTQTEPDSRVFIGAFPPSLTAFRQRSTKILDKLSIRKKPGASFQEVWFNQELELNSELIAIIGNKGSGKSAIADILGLIGNTQGEKPFSFLSPDRFKDRRTNKAKHFEATATWLDNKTDGPVSLDAGALLGAVETIKYIPQDYLEKICNEVSHITGSKFYDELQKVIFSHVPEAEQLGYSSLDELLQHRSEETKKTIDLLIAEMRSINQELVANEEQLSDNHLALLNAQLAAKQRELEAHETTKPSGQVPPSEDPVIAGNASIVKDQLQAHQTELTRLEETIVNAKKSLIETTKRRVTAERLAGKISNLEKQIRAAAIDALPDTQELGLEWDKLIYVNIDGVPVVKVLGEANDRIALLNKELDATHSPSAVARSTQTQIAISQLGQQLTAPQRAHEEYKAAVKRWTEIKDQLIGDDVRVGTLKYLQASISKLPEIRVKVEQLTADRMRKVEEIFVQKKKLRDDYGRFYGAVQRFLAEHPIAKSQQFKLTFNVSIAESGFTTAFLKLLNQRRAGSFAGLEDGSEKLQQLLSETNFDEVTETERFLDNLLSALGTDQRPGKGSAVVEIKDQLAQGVSITQLYDFIFDISYLNPIYSLKWDGKTLEQLSPGERGNLLLVFYLLIDRDDIPLVIDQPEENLDNNTVYRTLVPCVKEAKKRRQIFLVTHNPNLAIVCDAEQIICAEIHKDKANEVLYTSGAIEDAEINRRIVDILEGTRPAFDKRDAKYLAGGGIRDQAQELG